MPKVAIVALSDVHIEHGNPVLSRVGLIADAICSTTYGINEILILLPGDIVWSGAVTEFDLASTFLDSIADRIRERNSLAVVTFLCCPGNHDCVLPKEAGPNRKSKVDNALRTIDEESPDGFSLLDVLEPQNNYWAFSKQKSAAPQSSVEDKLCVNYLFERPGLSLNFHLINTALLSQRPEVKAGLYAPTGIVRHTLHAAPAEHLTVAVLHHWSGWIEPNNMMVLRQSLTGRADLVITGHQHFNAAYKHTEDSGEEFWMRESPALFDKEYPTSGAFRVLTLDFPSLVMQDFLFRWKKDRYRPTTEIDNTPVQQIRLNRRTGTSFLLSKTFLSELNDPGVAYIHSNRERILLSELFVYPDLKSKAVLDVEHQEIVRGEKVVARLSEMGVYVIQGSPLAGKTALAKQLVMDQNAQSGKITLLLSGRDIDHLATPDIQKYLRRLLATQYEDPDIDEYLQLSPTRRCIVVDDWHLARLNQDERLSWYGWLRGFTSNSILFTDELFEIKNIAVDSQKPTFTSDTCPFVPFSLIGLSTKSRGKLVSSWLRLRDDVRHDPPEISRASKDLEDLISLRLNRDSLAPYAFFVLCLLQAEENKSLDSMSGGSFGHLYEVLVTTALNKGREPDPLLHKKFALLQEMAMELWRSDNTVISKTRLEDITVLYTKRHLVKMPLDRLLTELVDTRVLRESYDHYSFAYEHFYLYFVARYVRDHMDDTGSSEIRELIDRMIDTISFSRHSTVIMFLIYFASERRQIIDRLLQNAASIYSDEKMATMEQDVQPFVKAQDLPSTPQIEEDPDIAKNRALARDDQDKRKTTEYQNGGLHGEVFMYTPDISDVKKLHLAERHIEVLGQVVRNFTTTLPGELKVRVISSVYELGLRTMTRLFHLLESGLNVAAILETREPSEDEPEDTKATVRELARTLDRLMSALAQIVSIHFCKQISSSVGAADLELAYSETYKQLATTTAVKIIDMTIRMDHSASFPESDVTLLYKSLNKNPFAQNICKYLTSTHLLMYKADRDSRIRIAKLFGHDQRFFEAAVARASQTLKNRPQEE